MLQVTPNGSWRKDVHPDLPVSLDELAVELARCFLAGATGAHLHVRDDAGAETLRPEVVDATCRRVREVAAEVGASVEIGLTTGDWIEPDLASRIAMIRDWEGVDCATVNVSERGFEQVMAAMLEVGIGIDAGLWMAGDLDHLQASGLLSSAQRISIELDPEEPWFPSGGPADIARRVNDDLDAAGSMCRRLTHGSGGWTWPLVADAFRRGHDTRVGFEDSVLLPDGSTARSNSQLVEAAVVLRRGVLAG